MATPKWQPGKLYPPGSLVVPLAEQPSGPVVIENPGFETGDFTGWTGDGGVAVSSGGAYAGTYMALFSGTAVAPSRVTSDAYPCAVGKKITASCMYQQGAADSGQNAGRVFLAFFDSSDVMIGSRHYGTSITSSSGGWKKSSVTATAPSGTAKVVIGCESSRTQGHVSGADNFSWDYINTPDLKLQYKATQAKAGYSATTEPSWPSTVGVPVIDNEVTWEGVLMSRVVWEASAILESGVTEPTWPLTIDGSVPDNTIAWSALDPITTDENCPNSKVVVIAKFKVYAGDKDVVRYTATLAPQDWTTEKNAGYLGTGVQQNGANDVAVMNLYRADLIVMNATTLQRWQIDPDPALMDLLDTLDGVGSLHHLASVPVSNDMFYLSNLGVRTIGITGASNNLSAGDVGLPVDPIVRELMAEADATGEVFLGMYWPSSGQYWLSLNRTVVDEDFIDGDVEKPKPGSPAYLCPTLALGDRYAEVMVYTLAQVGQVGAWSRYVFPFTIDDWTQEGDDLYVRNGDSVFRISDEVGTCDLYNPIGTGEGSPAGLPFNAMIQWPWLDAGAPAGDKQMESFEVVGYGRGWFEFGYDQSEPGYFTDPYYVVADTLRGTPVPMPLVAPSISVRVRYDGWNPADLSTKEQKKWGLNAISLNFS